MIRVSTNSSELQIKYQIEARRTEGGKRMNFTFFIRKEPWLLNYLSKSAFSENQLIQLVLCEDLKQCLREPTADWSCKGRENSCGLKQSWSSEEVLFQNSTDFQERTKNDSSTKMFIYWHGNKFKWITKFPNFLKVKKFKKNVTEHLPCVQCSDH